MYNSKSCTLYCDDNTEPNRLELMYKYKLCTAENACVRMHPMCTLYILLAGMFERLCAHTLASPKLCITRMRTFVDWNMLMNILFAFEKNTICRRCDLFVFKVQSFVVCREHYWMLWTAVSQLFVLHFLCEITRVTHHVHGSPWNIGARYTLVMWMTMAPIPCLDVSYHHVSHDRRT